MILPCEIITAEIKCQSNWNRVRSRFITFRQSTCSARKYEIGQGIFRSRTNIHTWNFISSNILNNAPKTFSTIGISFHQINMIWIYPELRCNWHDYWQELFIDKEAGHFSKIYCMFQLKRSWIGRNWSERCGQPDRGMHQSDVFL